MLLFAQCSGTFHSFHSLLTTQTRFDSEACVQIGPARYLSFAPAALLLGDMILKLEFSSDVLRALQTSETFCLWLLMDAWIVIFESCPNYLLEETYSLLQLSSCEHFCVIALVFPKILALLIHFRYSAPKRFHVIASVFLWLLGKHCPDQTLCSCKIRFWGLCLSETN